MASMRRTPTTEAAGVAIRPMSRSGVGGLAGSTASPRPGIKQQVEKMEATVLQHTEKLAEVAESVHGVADDTASAIRAMESSLKALINDVRRELITKVNGVAMDLQQLQQQINVLKGQQSVLGEQNKDVNRRLVEVSEVVADMQAELIGDDPGDALEETGPAPFDDAVVSRDAHGEARGMPLSEDGERMRVSGASGGGGSDGYER